MSDSSKSSTLITKTDTQLPTQETLPDVSDSLATNPDRIDRMDNESVRHKLKNNKRLYNGTTCLMLLIVLLLFIVIGLVSIALVVFSVGMLLQAFDTSGQSGGSAQMILAALGLPLLFAAVPATVGSFCVVYACYKGLVRN